MADMLAPAPVETAEAGPAPSGTGAARPAGGGRRRFAPYLGVLPFLAFVAVFLLWPTYIVVVGPPSIRVTLTAAGLKDDTDSGSSVNPTPAATNPKAVSWWTTRARIWGNCNPPNIGLISATKPGISRPGK